MSTVKEQVKKKLDFSKINVGERLSMTYYLKVTKKDRDSIDVLEQQSGQEFTIQGKDLIESTINSAAQWTEVRTINMSDAASILESAGDSVFTCNFNKKADEKSVFEALSQIKVADLADPKKLKKYSKEILTGAERTLVGYLIGSEPKLGRSQVIDLEIPAGTHNIRQIDHREIQSIILKGIKYIVK